MPPGRMTSVTLTSMVGVSPPTPGHPGMEDPPVMATVGRVGGGVVTTDWQAPSPSVPDPDPLSISVVRLVETGDIQHEIWYQGRSTKWWVGD